MKLQNVRNPRQLRKKALWVGLWAKKTPRPKRKKAIRKMSLALARRQREYRKLKREWKKDPINQTCRACPHPSTELHHSRGRIGLLLCDQRYWIPLCHECHEKVHRDINWARSLGLIAEKGKWNRADD